jgi:hypothetical protein
MRRRSWKLGFRPAWLASIFVQGSRRSSSALQGLTDAQKRASTGEHRQPCTDTMEEPQANKNDVHFVVSRLLSAKAWHFEMVRNEFPSHTSHVRCLQNAPSSSRNSRSHLCHVPLLGLGHLQKLPHQSNLHVKAVQRQLDKKQMTQLLLTLLSTRLRYGKH